MPLIHPERYNTCPPNPIHSINPDTLKQTSHTRYSQYMAGTHAQNALGSGRSFYGLKPYTPGDDCRLLDWSVYARSRHPHIRQYYQETSPVVWWVVLDSPIWQSGHTNPIWSWVPPCMTQVNHWLEQPKTGLWWLSEKGWFSQSASKADRTPQHFAQAMSHPQPLSPYGQTCHVIPETAFNRDMWIVLAPFQHPRLTDVWNLWPVPRHRLWVWEWVDPWWERWSPALTGLSIAQPDTRQGQTRPPLSVQRIEGHSQLSPLHANHLIIDVSRPLPPQLERFTHMLQSVKHVL